MGLLGRDDYLRSRPLPTEDVPCPEWGGTARLRGLTGAERDTLDEQNAKDAKGFSARLVALCAVDEDGRKVLSDADVALLQQASNLALERCAAAVLRLSKLGSGAVKEAEKNS